MRRAAAAAGFANSKSGASVPEWEPAPGINVSWGRTGRFLPYAFETAEARAPSRSMNRMILRIAILGGLLCAAGTPTIAADDATEIVRKSARHDQVNWERAHNYTFQQRVEERKGDGQGHFATKETVTFETVILYGQPFERRIAKNDKPLSDHDQKKEQEKFDKEVARRKRDSEEGRAQQTDEKELRKRQELRDEILRAFTFQLAGEEKIDGHDAYVIGAEPRSDYHPHSQEGTFLQAIHGKLWIDKVDYEWVRIDVEVIRPARFGLFIFTLSPGSTIYFEQARINDEVWMPKKVVVRLDGRLLFKRTGAEVVADFRDYRRFQTDSRITGVSDPLP